MAKIEKKSQEGFVNPFDAGVSYAQFLDSIPEGVSIKDHCEGKLEADQIRWIEDEIAHYKNK